MDLEHDYRIWAESFNPVISTIISLEEMEECFIRTRFSEKNNNIDPNLWIDAFNVTIPFEPEVYIMDYYERSAL